MTSVIEQNINYSLLCLSKLVFMKHAVKYNETVVLIFIFYIPVFITIYFID